MGAIGGFLVGAFLNGIVDRVNHVIDHAEDAVINIEVEAARQVSIVAQNLQNYYQADEQKLISDLNQAAQNVFGQLDTMITGIEDHVKDIIDKVDTDAQTIINSLGFGNRPQVTKMLPAYVAVGINTNEVIVTIQGNFKFASTKGFEPSLTLGDNTYTVLQNQTNYLEFMVPINLFSTALHQLSFVQGQLQVPWQEREYIVWTKDMTDTFKLWIGALPLSPGFINVTYTSQKTNRVYNTINQPGTIQFQKGDKQHTVSLYVDPNWQVAMGQGKSTLSLDPNFLDQLALEESGPTEYPTHVDFIIKTKGDWEVSGPVPYHIGMEQYIDQTLSIQRVIPKDLKFGDSLLLDDGLAGERVTKITLDDFNGAHSEFGAPNDSNPYLKVTQEGDFLKLSATIPTNH